MSAAAHVVGIALLYPLYSITHFSTLSIALLSLLSRT
jgi:hypothetical protein